MKRAFQTIHVSSRAKMRWGLPLTAFLLSGCVGLSALTPSELNDNPDQYDGKAVVVRGWLVSEFENVGIWDSKNAFDSGRPQSCLSYRGKDPGRHFSEAVILKGTFRKNINPPNVFNNGDCNESGLEVEGSIAR
jgi:hypothetical protein